MTLIFSTRRRGKRLNKSMDRLAAFVEHFGIIFGGVWDVRIGKGEIVLDAHGRFCDCERMPPLKRITPKIRARIGRYLDTNGFDWRWKR